MAKTIICADDSATMQKVAEITFGGSDFRYVGARSADEALKLAKSEKPALVLADAVMPGKTGYDLCQAIKSDSALAGVPVLLLCGTATPFDAARGAEVGADGFLPKPWDTQVMLDKVGEVVNKGQSAKPASGGVAPQARAATPQPVAAPRPASQPAAAAAAQPPRSATIMGMPAFPMPPDMLGNAAPVAPTPAARAAVPAPAASVKVTPPSAGGMDRAPMVRAGRPDTNQRIIDVLGRMPRVADVAKEAGLDPRGPEMQALLKLSYDVVERVVWEIVPELAEELIRDNLEKRAR